MVVRPSGSPAIRQAPERCGVKSSEQIAKSIFDGLESPRQSVVLAFRGLGYDWCDSLLNSSVGLVKPSDALRAEENERVRRLILEQQLRMAPTDAARRRRETAEHESAHATVSRALDVEVKGAFIAADGSGCCWHERTSPMQTAIIALAGFQWISEFRTFLRAPTGCGPDLRAARAALPDDWSYKQAQQRTFEILRDNQAVVITLADRIDREGDYLPSLALLDRIIKTPSQ